MVPAAAGISVVVFPAVSVGHALVAGQPTASTLPGAVTAVVAVGGSYPFVAGEWALDRLGRFVAGFVVAVGAVSLLGLVGLSRLSPELPPRTVARGLVLAVAYPVATAVALRGPGDADPSGTR